MLSTRSTTRQFVISAVAVLALAGISYPFTELIGYRAVALILMLLVSVLAMRLSLFPVLLAAVLSAAIWDFFFIPPHFTFHVNDSADALMLGMYFIIALLNGVLTARIRRFEKIAREKEAQVHTLQLYDSLFNSLSHELRTPIATILGASDNLLAPDSNLEETDKQALITEINSAGERLHHLTDDLLNLSRLDSGLIRPVLDWCDPLDLIHTAIRHSGAALSQHQVQVQASEALPLVQLDFVLMEQVLHNLLLNAAKYSPEGGRITVTLNGADHQLRVTVTDSGPGFPAAKLDRVFEKFYRLSNSKVAGLGLGLAIAKGFVEAHGGVIQAENVPNQGGRISLRIPVENKLITPASNE